MKPINVTLLTENPGKPFMRQAPKGIAKWGQYIFTINEYNNKCDFCVVYGGLGKKELVHCPKSQTILITNEPPSVKKYNKTFTNQFGTVLTCHKNIKHPHVLYTQQALPWWVGHKTMSQKKIPDSDKTYDELSKTNTIPQKTKLLSVITSNKSFTKGHKKRLAFLKTLQQEFGDSIDIFGKGFNDINDKWEALATYKYHLVLENTNINDYWTEKLADAFLAQCYPIYYGCPNITKYFPNNSLTIIDINKIKKSIQIIRSTITSNTFEKNIPEINIAKSLILNKYQLFPMIVSHLQNMPHKKEKSVTVLHPEKESLYKKTLRNVKEFIKKFI